MPKKLSFKEGKLIGRVNHYYDKIKVAVLKLQGVLSLGDKIRIEGGGKSFSQGVASMEVNHQKIKRAKKGSLIGLKVKQKVREGYRVYKL